MLLFTAHRRCLGDHPIAVLTCAAVLVASPGLAERAMGATPAAGPSKAASHAARCGPSNGHGEGPWPQFGGDNTHSGTVTVASRSAGQLHRQWESAPMDGAVYAEPLVAGGCIYVATEGGSVYALGQANGAVRWHTRLAPPVTGGLPCGDITPSGVTGTPVLDAAKGELWAVTITDGPRGPEHELFALSAATGRVLRRQVLAVPGADPAAEQQRAALVTEHGNVYVPFGGLYGDCGNYVGAVASVPEAGNRSPGWWRVPTSRGAGIWEPGAPEVLANGRLLFADGNGAASPGQRFDGSNAVFELTPGLRTAGYFTPRDWAQRNETDTDLGSTAPAVTGGGLALATGKDGLGFVLSARRLGGIGGQLAQAQVCSGGGAYGSDAVSGDVVYVPCTGGIVAVRVSAKSLRALWSSGAGGAGDVLVGGSRVFEETGSGQFIVLAAANGRLLQSLHLSAPATHFPWAVPAGHVIYTLDGQRLAALAGL